MDAVPRVTLLENAHFVGGENPWIVLLLQLAKG